MHRIALLVCLIAILFAADADARTWQDKSGKFSIEGEYVSFVAGNVRIRRSDGRIVRIAMSRLSADDQAFVKEILKNKATGNKPGAKPPTPSPATTVSTKKSSTGSGGGDWHRWRGPNADGISTETGLLDRWTGDGPPLVWSSRGMGRGMSSVVVSKGKIYTMGKIRGSGAALICASDSDGSVLWSTPAGDNGETNATPTVDVESNLVFGTTKEGNMICANAQTGQKVWSKSFKNDFGGKMMSGWGYSESPLVDGDRLIVTPGGDRGVLVALDKKTGRGIWSTTMSGAGGAGYATPVVANCGGVKQYITLIRHGIIGVSAKTGKLLWHYKKIGNGTANIPTPIVKGDYVFCSTGYGDGGSALLQVGKGGRGVREIWYKSNRELQNHHGGMVLIGKYIYMGHGHNNGLPVCVDMASGRIQWGPERGAGRQSAALVAAEGHLYFRYEDGTMALVEATPKGYNLKGSFTIASVNGKSWPHPVIAGKRLYLRDQDQLHCYNIAAQ